jgi:hypothetical protein
MLLPKNILFTLLTLSYLLGGTPLEYTVGVSGGYDNNMMRFSSEEIQNAASDLKLMGGASTFDSFVFRLNLSGKKIFWDSGKREFSIHGNFSWADYKQSPNKQYGAGGIDAIYKWGSYQNIKYSIRHLDSYYLRHYINRDIGNDALSPCAFTDQNQKITLSQKVGRRQWINFGVGYLQRYYDKPFIEFDLDIIYLSGKFNKKIKQFGIVSFQFDRGRAISQSHYLPERPSSFNRSYETMEWYLPIKLQKRIPFFKEIGISMRQETRVYEAEDPNDPLHAGRNHIDSKVDVWVKKKLNDALNITLSGRYRTRETESAFNWVTDLKSFNQLQFWCKIEWDMIYDRY